MIKTCLICQKNFNTSHHKSKCCSNSCKYKLHSLRSLGHKPYHWKGGRYKHRGYVYILVKNHPRSDRDGYILEHRYIMEKHIGRLLNLDEDVHHKNHIKDDNRIENLILLTHTQHARTHRPKGTHFYKGKHPWIGKKHSEESRKKMSITRSKKK